MVEKNEASAKAGPGALLGGEPGSYNPRGPKNQSNRTVLTDPLGHLIGSPVVVVEEVAGQGARVRVATLDRVNGSPVLGSAPWGWAGKDKTFLCHKARSAMAWRYAEELQSLIRIKAVDELELRHRREAARRREREGRQ